MSQVLNVEAKEIHEWLMSRFKLQKNWFFKYKAVQQKQKEILTKIKRDLNEIETVQNFFQNKAIEKIDFLQLENLEQILINSPEGQKRNFFNQYSSVYIKEIRAIIKLQKKQFMHIASLGKDINEYLQFTLPSNYKIIKENQNQIQILEYKRSQALSSIKMTQKDILNLIEDLVPQYKVENLQEFSLNDFLNNFIHQLPGIVSDLEQKCKKINIVDLIKHYQAFQKFNYPEFNFNDISFQKLEKFFQVGDYQPNENYTKIDMKKYIDQQGFSNEQESQDEWVTEIVNGELQLVQKTKNQEDQIKETIFLNRDSREQLVLCIEELYYFVKSRIEEIESSTQADLQTEFFDLTQQMKLENLQDYSSKLKEILDNLQDKKINTILSILENSRNKTKITMQFERYLNLIEKNKQKKNFCEEKKKELQQEIGKSKREIRDMNQKVIRLRQGIEKLLKIEFKNNFVLITPKLKK